MPTSHEDIMSSIRVLQLKVETLQARQVEIREDVASIRKDLRSVLLHEAEQRGTWDGVKIGARLTLLAIAAALGAGVAKLYDWVKGVG